MISSRRDGVYVTKNGCIDPFSTRRRATLGNFGIERQDTLPEFSLGLCVYRLFVNP